MMTFDRYAGYIRASGGTEFWIAALLAAALAAAALWGALVFLGRKRVIESIPTARVRSAPQGYIELQGWAELMDGDPILAPLSARRCVWYSYEVERREQRGSGANRATHWRTIERGTSDDLFYLADATGRCAVDPEGAAVTPAHRNVWYGTSRVPGRYHSSDGVWWARLLGQLGQPYRYRERRIEPGDAIYAIGDFATHGGAATAFDRNGAVGDRLREWKRDRTFLLREFDADGDGGIDVREWDAARARAEREVTAEQRHAPGPPPVDLLARTRDGRRPFVIAAGTEEALIARCRWSACGLLAAGVPLLCLTLWAIGVRMGNA